MECLMPLFLFVVLQLDGLAIKRAVPGDLRQRLAAGRCLVVFGLPRGGFFVSAMNYKTPGKFPSMGN